ncbi:CinA family protein [Neptunomonas japonica]|uniref:Competence damage-inducible protein A n=1 Tax=Neptunomonas japonica JAMM 1380 TaxID=1441457 RepID=A0A7R6SUQ9_9GAMM|nr:CinA family protein [Neptunomonas japonica]BBB28606.1 competence damage-inducible protein A [Neptunomonas japonica JAMM 1380]
MSNLAEEAGIALKSHAAVLATAESCTGGGIAQAVTAVAGSSEWFGCGYVTYSNEAKQQMLGVNPDVIEAHGAVSEAVVRQMAEGALSQSGADIAVAVSGVAGPGGGTKDKPVGTVWLAWAIRGEATVAIGNLFLGDREQVRNQSIEKALEGIISLL